MKGRGSEVNSEVGTHELTEYEIALARVADVLRVEDDGRGFVPRDWIESLRKNVDTEEPS